MWTKRLIPLCSLLVALAVQGITPDSRDLSSSRLLPILRPSLSEWARNADGRIPPIERPNEPEDHLEEVCTPAFSLIQSLPRLIEDLSRASVSERTLIADQLSLGNARNHVGFPPPTQITPRHLLLELCRMSC